MDSTQREACNEQLSALFGAWGRNYSPGLQEGYWLGLKAMSLPELARCVEAAIDQFSKDAKAPLPNVGALWAIKRSLRAKPLDPEPADTWVGDAWDIAGNRHLLAFFMRAGMAGRKFTLAQTQIFVAAKKRWSQVMRETDDRDVDSQQALWAFQLAEAEREIAHAA